jgi:DNA-binding PadR family transcriptional regulator
MELSPTAKVVLGMIAFGAQTGYEIKRQVERSTAFFWGASFGQIYPELERLERAGLIRASSPGVRNRREFEVTRAGRAALAEWLERDDPGMFAFRSEALLKAFFADLAPDEVKLANARAAISWCEQVLALFRTIVADGSSADALDFGLGFMEWQLDWWRRYERRLRARARRRPQSGTRAPARR